MKRELKLRVEANSSDQFQSVYVAIDRIAIPVAMYPVLLQVIEEFNGKMNASEKKAEVKEEVKPKRYVQRTKEPYLGVPVGTVAELVADFNNGWVRIKKPNGGEDSWLKDYCEEVPVPKSCTNTCPLSEEVKVSITVKTQAPCEGKRFVRRTNYTRWNGTKIGTVAEVVDNSCGTSVLVKLADGTKEWWDGINYEEVTCPVKS